MDARKLWCGLVDITVTLKTINVFNGVSRMKTCLKPCAHPYPYHALNPNCLRMADSVTLTPCPWPWQGSH
eukprot:1159964-Pelagomonas_calceolata.AAC.10